jgi:hypothetical protein
MTRGKSSPRSIGWGGPGGRPFCSGLNISLRFDSIPTANEFPSIGFLFGLVEWMTPRKNFAIAKYGSTALIVSKE